MTVRIFSISTGLAASTVTPGSTAPDVSLTVPVMDAWANTAEGRSTVERIMTAHLNAERMCSRLLGAALGQRPPRGVTNWGTDSALGAEFLIHQRVGIYASRRPKSIDLPTGGSEGETRLVICDY